MRDVLKTKPFIQDLKRIFRGKYRDTIDITLAQVISDLARDIPLETHKYRDHSLKGQWKFYRECHIKPDLLLIYRKTR